MSEAEAREKTERLLKVGRAARARIMGGLVLAVPVLLLKLHWIYIVFLSLYILQSVINLLFIRKGMGLYIASYLRTGLDLVLVTWAVHFAGAHSSIVIIAYPLICVLCTVSNTLRMGVTMSVLGSGLYLSLLLMEYRGVLPHPPLLAGMPYDASSVPMLLSSWIIMSLSMFGGTFAAGGIMRQLREKDEELEKAHGELKKLFREREVERVRLSEELKEAREIQERLFPRLDRPIKGLEIDGACMISQEVGGDYYDVSADRQGRVAVWIGDVSGKGAGAALVMTMIKSACNLSVPSLGSPRDLLVMLNAHLRALAPTRSMTFFFMTADIPGRRLIFSNAGHPTPYLSPRLDSVRLPCA